MLAASVLTVKIYKTSDIAEALKALLEQVQ